MAASAILNKEIDELVICNICSKRVENPKSLNCNDSFCKPCLDSVLQFRPDGSATISCPLGCEEQTEIHSDKTTNDLETPPQVMNINDFLDGTHQGGDETGDHIRCDEYPKCRGRIAVSCPVCFIKLCSLCKRKHKHEELQNSRDIEFIAVKYNQGSDELLPWCDEHATYAKYFCQEGFTCLYCKARSHSNHCCEDIETLSQDIEDWVRKQEPQLTDLKYRITTSKEKTQEEVHRIKKNLTREVRRRKYIAIQDYLKKLSDEENRLFDQFDSTISNHFSSYPLCKPDDYIENKPKFEIFANKSYIFQSVENVTSKVVAVPNISLTYSVKSMNETHPLGLLEGNMCATELTEGLVTVSSVIGEGELTNKGLRTQAEDLKSIREEYEHQDEDLTNCMVNDFSNVKSSSTDDDKRYQDILEAYMNKDNAQSKMSYLCELITDNDIESFKFMWKTIPQELLQLQHNGYNMLHFAATFNKPKFAKIVLDAGMDINKNKDGVTALLMATAFGNLSTVQMLVECDADILLEEVEVNAIDVAKMVYNPDIVEYLSEHLKKCKMKDTGMLSEKNFEKTLRALAIIRDKCVDDVDSFGDSEDDLLSFSDFE